MTKSHTSVAALADQVRVAAIIRDLSPKQLEAWLVCGERIVAGMLPAEAEALMWRELAVSEAVI